MPLLRGRADHTKSAEFMTQLRIGSVQELAKRANLNRSYTTRLLRLSWLAPDITQAILRGYQPPVLTADKLIRLPGIPIDWQAQKVALGFN